MKHSDTIRYFFSKIKKQSKSEKYFTLHSFASELGVEVDPDNLYLGDKDADAPIALDSISRILIANGCFYIQFEADSDYILVLEAGSQKHQMALLEPSCCQLESMRTQLLGWFAEHQRMLKYLFARYREVVGSAYSHFPSKRT